VQGEYTFSDAAQKFSDREESRLNGGLVVNPESGDTQWETGQLDKSVFYALEGIKENEITEPVFFRTPDEKEGYRLLRLLNRTEAHVANLSQDYQRVQNVALAEKKQNTLQEWVEDKLDETYVRVNNDYLQCTFERNWIKQSQYSN
jgi:PPIC-type PPIASE domain.